MEKKLPGVYKRVGKKGHVWVAVFPLPGRRQKWIQYSTLRAANAAKSRDNMERIHRPPDEDPVNPKRPFSEVIQEFLKDLKLRVFEGTRKPSTLKSYASVIATHIQGSCLTTTDRGRVVTVGQITPKLVNRWRDEIIKSRRLAPKSVKNVVLVLRSICSWAVRPENGFMMHNPAADLRAGVKFERQEAPFLEEPEYRQLIKGMEADGVDPVARVITFLGIMMGLRRGEIFGLKWSDIERRNGKHFLRVQRSNYQMVVTRTKTYRMRVLDVPQVMVDELDRWREIVQPGKDDFIIPGAKPGKPADPDATLRETWIPAAQKAVGRRITAHTLRHTHASILLAAGHSMKAISERLGHSSTEVTAAVYSHILRGTRAAMTNSLDQAAGRTPAIRKVG